MNSMSDQAVYPPANPSVTAKQSYSSEAVEAILSRALDLQFAETYSSEQLQAMAAELNIPPETLALAEQHWRSHQAATAQRAQALAKRQRDRRQQWIQYGLGSLLMIGIDIATAGTVTWSVFPVLGWGLAVCFGVCSRPKAENLMLQRDASADDKTPTSVEQASA